MWTEENLPEGLRSPAVYERIRMPAERSDILRLDLLYRYGGVYIDTDFECRRSIEQMIGDDDFFAAYAKPDKVNNAIIGATAGHPIIDHALREVRPREFFGHDKRGTGPLFFGAVLANYPDVKIFEPGIFYPSSEEEEQNAVAIHHRARSWMAEADLRKAMSRLEKRTIAAETKAKKAEARLRKIDRKAQRRATSSVRRTLERARRTLGP
jgi:mannosyltransferase OCH1-like enzyme